MNTQPAAKTEGAYTPDGQLKPQSTPLVMRTFSSAEEMDLAIQAEMDRYEYPLMSAMAAATGCEPRTLREYLAGGIGGLPDEWLAILKRHWLTIMASYERGLHSKYTVGSIFALKNMGWSDQPDAGRREGGSNGFQVVLNLNIGADPQPPVTIDVAHNGETQQLTHGNSSQDG